jgi:WD40 repeat protein/serine/threonine protein kinase
MDTDLEIFLQAPENPSPEELARYLDDACGENKHLRSRVEALFVADGVEEGIVDQAPRISDSSAPLEAEGNIIHNYKLLQKIGEGGFGDVYMAEQFQPVKRRVALKIIKLGMDTKQVVARFEAERQALAMMDHPNIAKVHDAGATELGRPYFVMELVRGIPITKFCDEQNLDTKDRLALFIDVCHAVQHAHQKGVIHRDLKPSNVMVTMHDDRPVVKVIDFGVAKATQTDLTDKTLFTKFDQFIGTPAYMSPEQAQFSGLDIDTRSDIYTLGVLLYELLTGSTPFDSKQMLSAGCDEIRRIIKEDEPELPSSRLSTFGKAELTDLAKHRRTAPARLHSLVKGDLDWIVMKSIEKDRTRRYETANAFAADISRHLDDEPVVAAAPSTIYRAQKYLNRHRALLTTAALVIASLLIGTTVSIWKAIEANRATATAEEATATAKEATKSEERQRKNVETEKLIGQHRLAEEKLASGESALGIAHLARLVRDDNTNLIAAERLVSAIRENPQSRIEHIFEMKAPSRAVFSHDGSKILIVSRNGDAEVVDTVTKKRLSPQMEASGGVATAYFKFSPDDRLIVICKAGKSHNSCSATVFDWRTGDRLHPTFQLDSKAQTCEFSPDSTMLLIGCPHKAQVWDLKTGKPWDQAAETVNYRGRFSPDSSLVVFTNGKVREARSGKTLPSIPFPTTCYTVNFSPDSQHLITASPDGGVRIWEPRSGKLITTLRHQNPVSTARYSPDGRTILTASPNGELNTWDSSTYQAVRKFKMTGERISSADFSANGRWLYCSTFFGNTYGWDLHLDQDPVFISRTQVAGYEVHGDSLNPEGNLFLSPGGRRSNLVVLHKIVPTQPMIQTFRHQESTQFDVDLQGVSVATFRPDGDQLITGGIENSLAVWDSWTGKKVSSVLHGGGFKFRGEFSSDGKYFLGTSSWNGLKIWNTEDGTPIHSLDFNGRIVHAAFSPVNADGGYYFVVAPEGQNSAQVYKLGSSPLEKVGAPLTYGGSTESLEFLNSYRANFSPDASRIVTTSYDGHARVWDVESGDPIFKLAGHTSGLSIANYSPDGSKIVTASSDHTAAIWDATSGELIHLLKYGTEPLNYAEFSPDSQWVVTAGESQSRIWNATTGEPQGLPLLHEGFIRTARFSPDGLRILTCSFDQTARLWDARTGLPLSGPFHHDGYVFSASFSPDGNRIVTSGADSLAHIWDYPPAPHGSVPSWVPAWAEAVAGIRINDSGTEEPISQDDREEIIADVSSHPDDAYYSRIARWLASDQETRPISPFSKMSKETWVQNRILEASIDGLEEALAAAPFHPEVMAALAKALVDSATGDRGTNLAQAAVLVGQIPSSPEQNLLVKNIETARAVHAFDQRVTQLEEEAIAAADTGETSSLAPLHKALMLANFIAQSEKDFKTTSKLRSPQDLIDIELQARFMIEEDAQWRYLDNNQAPPSNWISPDFDESSWALDPAPLGYGDKQTTEVKGKDTRATAFYFRHRFDHRTHPAVENPTLRLQCDDGAVVYLNGREVLRYNMPEGPITHETPALTTVSGVDETKWNDFEIDSSLLKDTGNLLAVEVHQKHQENKVSSDLNFAIEFCYRHSEASYLEQFDAATLTNALSRLTLALPRELAPIYQARWQSAILPGSPPETSEGLDLRAKFLHRLKRYEDELSALHQLLLLYPVSTDYSDFLIHIDCLRRISQCLHALRHEDEALAFETRIQKTMPLRQEDLSPLMLDLTDYFNLNFCNIKAPPFVGSQDYWGERIPQIFEPGEGPDFDARGVIQLDSGKLTQGNHRFIGKTYSEATGILALNKVKIEVDQTFGAIHFLQTCFHLREHVGTEIAHYLIHYEDGTQKKIPVIVGEGIADYNYKQWHPTVIENVRHLALDQSFKWSQRNNNSSRFGLFRQSWTNPDPEKRVAFLEFISAEKQGAPCLLAITLEPKEKVAERNKALSPKLRDLEAKLQRIPGSNEPVYIRERRNLLRDVVPILEDLGKHDPARELTDELFSIPPRPEGLSSKLIDLTPFYTESFFLPGIHLTEPHDTLNWSRIPEEFQAVGNPEFDIRGVIRLNGGKFPRGTYRDGKTLNTIWTSHCPDQVSIPINQKFETIHFLQTCGFWNVAEDEEVAQYILHYEDGTHFEIPVIWDKTTFNYDHFKIEAKSLAPFTEIAHTFTARGNNGQERRISLIRQTVTNPHPNKLVTHLDFVSGKKSTGPVLAGITVE